MFREEAVEYVSALSSCLLDLEERPHDLETLQDGLRNAHSLKGCAQMIDLNHIAVIAHAVEDVLRGCESQELKLTTQMANRLLGIADFLAELVDRLPEVTEDDSAEEIAAEVRQMTETPEAASEESASASASAKEEHFPPPKWHPSTPPQSPPPKPAHTIKEDTIRVRTSKLDELQALIARLAMTELQMEDKFLRCQRLQSLLKEAPTADLPVCKEVEELGTWLIEARASCQKLVTDFSENILQLRNLSEQIQYQSMVTRMLPFGTITGEFRRVVRDTAEELHKEVQLIVEGEKQEVDRHLIEEMRAPIMHIVRNCIGHGIESPEKRRSLGKEPVGTITIKAERERGRVIITCQDDGKGIDPGVLKQTAVSSGMITAEEASQMSDYEAMYLIMRPGFSTAETVSELSGRGVGMDVVKRNVERLRGRIEIQSQTDEYTRFRMFLPLSLSLMNVLLVSAHGNTFGLPVHALEAPDFIDPTKEIFTEGGQETLWRGGRSVPLYSLAKLAGLEDAQQQTHVTDRLKVIMLHHDEQHLAVVVDDLLEQEKVAIESRGRLLSTLPLVAGTSILGNGDPCIILHVPELFRAASRAGAGGHNIAQRIEKSRNIAKKKLLVVEDSLTTRTMEKSILESFGYVVDAAASGEEALSLCEKKTFDLIVTDIQMPGMDGFQFIEKLREDKRFEQTPIVVVSSQYNQQNLQRGAQLSVEAYIGKGTFQQSHLMEAIQGILTE